MFLKIRVKLLVREMRTPNLSVHPNFLTILKEPFATNDFLDFVPRSLIINKKEETPRGYRCLIGELPTTDGNT